MLGWNTPPLPSFPLCQTYTAVYTSTTYFIPATTAGDVLISRLSGIGRRSRTHQGKEDLEPSTCLSMFRGKVEGEERVPVKKKE